MSSESPKKVRIANNSHVAGVPFRLLEELPFVEFHQAPPKECARLLHEGEADLALIPLFDFFIHGGYGTLEFGMGCRQRSGSMILYARRAIQELQKIHVYSSSRTSLAILMILLKERWRCSPQIIRHDRHDILSCMQEFEGVLMLHDIPPRALCDFPVCMDLATEWYQHTHRPSPFLVWAARPGAISKSAITEISAAMYRGIHIKADLARLYAHEYSVDTDVAVEFVDVHRRFHLDAFMLSGLEKFRELGVRHHLVPNAPCAMLRQQIAGAPYVTTSTERIVPTILGEIQAGIPLSIQDAKVLFEKASTAELARARQSLVPDRQAQTRLTLHVHPWPNSLEFTSVNEKKPSEERHVVLLSRCESLPELDVALDNLRSMATVRSTYISIDDVILLSERLGVVPLALIAKILACGARGCLEPIPRILLKGEYAPSYDPRSWLDLAAILHGLGLKTALILPSWECLGGDLERYLLHLEKLRSLHAETQGLEGLLISAQKRLSEHHTRLRLITELFLPDVPAIDVTSLFKGSE